MNEINKSVGDLTPEMVDALLMELHKPRFTIKDTEVKHRNITHWGHEGLLVGEFQEGKWRRLNYLEILWLRIMAHMRSYEIPLKLIRKVREAICMDNIPLWALYEDLGIIGPGMREKYSIPISSLTSIVLQTILFRSQFVLILDREGGVKSLNLDKADQTIGFFSRYDLSAKTFLCVSITEVMLDSFRKIGPAVLSQLSVLTTPEAEVIGLLRVDKFARVTINLNEVMVSDLDDLSAGRDRIAVLLELIWRQGYRRITWASSDGRVTYFDCPVRFNIKPEPLKSGSPESK